MTDTDQKKIFSKNLNYYLSLNQKSQREVALAISVSPQTFNTWCQGIALPRMGKVQRLADYFHIEKSDLIDDKSTRDNISSTHSYSSISEQKLLSSYRSLNTRGRERLLSDAQEMTCNPLYNDNYLLAVAAHQRTDIVATDSEKKHDDDIMNDDSKWE